MAGGGVGGGEGDFYPTNDPHLPTDHPQCMNKTCRAFEEGWRLSEEEIPFLTQLEYGKWTVYFYAFWIFLFAVRHWYRRFREYFVVPHAELRRSRPSRAQRITAAWRFWIYRRLGGRLMSLELPPYGTLALLTLSTVFMGVSPFVEEPYLRTLFRFGSPPLSVRCAMIISALTPLVVALAGKVNLVTILTGICYSKLNIFHRYSACVLFYLSTVHTIPHLIAPVRDGGWKMLQFLFDEKFRELSGAPLYGVCFGLCFFSIPWVRKRAYELFVYMHIFLAVCYLAILYWHIKGEYMSPDYLYGAVAVWGVSSFTRLFFRNRFFRKSPCLKGYSTTLEQLSGNMTRVTVSAPGNLTWRPGQHAYIRMPRLSWWDNHPFTIASIPTSTLHNSSMNSHKKNIGRNELIFLVRSHTGFTHTLASHVREVASPFSRFTFGPRAKRSDDALKDAPSLEKISVSPFSLSTSSLVSPSSDSIDEEKHRATSTTSIIDLSHDARRRNLSALEAQTSFSFSTEIRTLVDGPYGAHGPKLHHEFESVYCIAGGSGITACLPWILDLSCRMNSASTNLANHLRRNERPEQQVCVTRRLHLIWLVRSVSWLTWIRSELDTALKVVEEAGANRSLHIDVFVTSKAPKGSIDAAGSPTVGAREDGLARLERAHVEARLNALVTAEEMQSQWKEKKFSRAGGRAVMQVRYERPNLTTYIPKIVKGSTAYLMGCGPEPMKVDLANTVAQLQKRVLAGEMNEIALNTETFGW